MQNTQGLEAVSEYVKILREYNGTEQVQTGSGTSSGSVANTSTKDGPETGRSILTHDQLKYTIYCTVRVFCKHSKRSLYSSRGYTV